MEKLPLCQPLDLGDFQPVSKAAAGCRGRQCLVSAGEAPGAASPLHAQPASLQTQKRKNLPLSSEGDVMTEAKVAKPGRKQETTPQHGRMNLHFGAPLPSQNEPFFGLQFIPVSPSREWGLWLRPFVSPGCSGAKLRVVPKAPPWAVLLQEGFFHSLWWFWHHFHACQEPRPLILPEHPQSFHRLPGDTHGQDAPSCIPQLGTRKSGAPQAGAAPTFIPNP